MAPTSQAIIEGVIEVLQEIDGIGNVVSQENAPSTWSQKQGSLQSYWVVNSAGSDDIPQSTSGRRERRMSIDGWMTFDSRLNSASAWRALLETVLAKLVSRRRMKVCAMMRQLPIIESNRIELYQSANQNDTARECHHCRITFSVIRYSV